MASAALDIIGEDGPVPHNGERRSSTHMPVLSSDESKEDIEQLLVEVQAKSRYFRGFVDEVPKLAEMLSVVSFDEGETILQRGEEGTWVGLVLSGELSVIIEGKAVATVNPGDFLGEMILWYGGVRQSTVLASSSGVIATMLTSEARAICLEDPQLSMKLFHAIGQQSVAGFLAYSIGGRVSRQVCATSLRKVPLKDAREQWEGCLTKMRTRGFDVGEQAEEYLMSQMQVHAFGEGDTLVRPGDKLDLVLLLVEGAVKVNTPHATQYAAPDMLGEFAFWQEATQAERRLEVVGTEPGLVAVISIERLHEAMQAMPSLLFATMQLLGKAAMQHARDPEKGAEATVQVARANTTRQVSVAPTAGGAGAPAGGEPSDAMEVFYRKRLEKQKKEEEALKSAAAKADREKERMLKKQHSMKNDALRLEREVRQLSTEVTRLRDHERGMPALRVQLTKLSADNEALALLAKGQATQLQQTSREYFEETITRKSEEVELAKFKLANAEARLAQSDAAGAAEREKAAAQSSELERRDAALKAEAERREKAQAQAQELQRGLAEQRAAAEGAAAEVARLSEALASADEDNATLRQEIGHLSGEATKSKQKVDSMRKAALVATNPSSARSSASLHSGRHDEGGGGRSSGGETSPGRREAGDGSAGRRERRLSEAGHPIERSLVKSAGRLACENGELRKEVLTLEAAKLALAETNVRLGAQCEAQAAQLFFPLQSARALLEPTAQRVENLDAELSRRHAHDAAQARRIEALEQEVGFGAKLRVTLARLALTGHEHLTAVQLAMRTLGAEAHRGASFWPQLERQVGGIATAAAEAQETLRTEALPLTRSEGGGLRALGAQLRLLAAEGGGGGGGGASPRGGALPARSPRELADARQQPPVPLPPPPPAPPPPRATYEPPTNLAAPSAGLGASPRKKLPVAEAPIWISGGHAASPQPPGRHTRRLASLHALGDSVPPEPRVEIMSMGDDGLNSTAFDVAKLLGVRLVGDPTAASPGASSTISPWESGGSPLPLHFKRSPASPRAKRFGL